jgi:arsenite-transporting ATPase
MVETFSGKYNPDEGDDFLVEMKKTVNRIEGLLRDGKACEFIAVTIPEDMAIQETERLVNNLNKFGLKLKQLVVNNVLELRHCEFCRERSKAQEEYIKQIRRKFSHLKTTIIPLQPREVKGVDTLNNFSRLLLS